VLFVLVPPLLFGPVLLASLSVVLGLDLFAGFVVVCLLLLFYLTRGARASGPVMPVWSAVAVSVALQLRAASVDATPLVAAQLLALGGAAGLAQAAVGTAFGCLFLWRNVLLPPSLVRWIGK
jgi:hypothetical protein